jgi:hypothetical protein
MKFIRKRGEREVETIVELSLLQHSKSISSKAIMPSVEKEIKS